MVNSSIAPVSPPSPGSGKQSTTPSRPTTGNETEVPPSGGSDSQGQRRSGLAVPGSNQPQCSSNKGSPSRHCDRNGCISSGIGCKLSGTEDRRSLVLGGAGTLYQCLGAKGSSSGHSDLYKRDRTPTHPSEDGQCNSKSLHQSCWGDSLSNPQFNSIGNMEMMSRSSPLLDSIVSPRSGEFGGRQGVQAARRPVQLYASPISFQAHKREPGSSGSGPVCIQADPSVTKLETGPSSRSHRRTDAELGADLRICEPSLVSDTDSPDKDLSREGKSGSGGPVWKTQPWYLLFLDLLFSVPHLLPQRGTW